RTRGIRPAGAPCACHPRGPDEFRPELPDRLLGGAVWGLAPPDTETRLAILQSKSLRLGEPVAPENVLHHLANKLRGNVRELEGALHTPRHLRRVTSMPIHLPMSPAALADLLRP